MEKIYDFLGNEITTGALIAYGYVSQGNYGLKYGKILSIKSRKVKRVLNAKVKMSVQPLETTNAGYFKLRNHKVTLRSPNRMVVVTSINSPKKEIYG